jgi:hypothetical protein
MNLLNAARFWWLIFLRSRAGLFKMKSLRDFILNLNPPLKYF